MKNMHYQKISYKKLLQYFSQTMETVAIGAPTERQSATLHKVNKNSWLNREDKYMSLKAFHRQ